MLRCFFGIGRIRIITHIGLLATTLAAIYITTFYTRTASWQYVLTIGCGYLSLTLIVLTLSIGTIKLFLQRRNPVNLYIRRDLGIWAGFTGIIHVI
ncbi:MAG TPA: hypothetical protein VHL11_20500, partial [Phototrophicaceae bacterium]|nr:hypothetical protein [Phototrophicaceae bacterium]